MRSHPVAKVMKANLPNLHAQTSANGQLHVARSGAPLPLGTLESGGGVNFSIFSRYASRVRLELFDHPEDSEPIQVFDLDSRQNRTGDVWHVWVGGIGHA